jgi:hypothetical protein
MFSNLLFSILIRIIISILIIYGIHQIWEYLKDTYSTKKTKDLVNTQIQKYKKMMNEIQENNKLGSPSPDENVEINIESMDKDLTEFMNTQMLQIS